MSMQLSCLSGKRAQQHAKARNSMQKHATAPANLTGNVSKALSGNGYRVRQTKVRSLASRFWICALKSSAADGAWTIATFILEPEGGFYYENSY